MACSDCDSSQFLPVLWTRNYHRIRTPLNALVYPSLALYGVYISEFSTLQPSWHYMEFISQSSQPYSRAGIPSRSAMPHIETKRCQIFSFSQFEFRYEILPVILFLIYFLLLFSSKLFYLLSWENSVTFAINNDNSKYYLLPSHWARTKLIVVLTNIFAESSITHLISNK